MSLFPAYFGARKRPDDEQPAPAAEPENESRAEIFNLIPPQATEKYERPKDTKPATTEKPAGQSEKTEGRNIRPATAVDLSRLSIDEAGQLYWDGKPVEVRRRLMMSRRQAVAASLIAFFIVVAAIGSAVQAAATLSDWACRNGFSQCTAKPAAPTPKPAPEIPA